jgi:rhamnulokinase
VGRDHAARRIGSSVHGVVDVDAPDFLAPGDMPQRIREYAVRTGQPAPQDVGDVTRVVLESLALKYRWTLERLDRLTDRRIPTLHIVGGGTQNRLLSQLRRIRRDEPS